MRYFIIFYVFTNSKPHVSIFGSTTAKGNTYPNKKETESSLEKGHGVKFVHVINIIELNEEDYNNWKT